MNYCSDVVWSTRHILLNNQYPSNIYSIALTSTVHRHNDIFEEELVNALKMGADDVCED